MVRGVKMNWDSMGTENTITGKDKYNHRLILMQNQKEAHQAAAILF